MTLLLTECSKAGIVMAADSAISQLSPSGKIRSIDHVGWRKVLRAPRAKALVGYWGHIGSLYKGRFDEWLDKQLQLLSFSDLPSLASAIANLMNERCKGRILADGKEVGFHVAGLHPWADGAPRAFFYHVHNGHCHYALKETSVPSAQGPVLIKVEAKWISCPRTQFTPYQDFPSLNHTLKENEAILEGGYITRNGHYLYHTIAWDRLRSAFAYMNLIDGVSIPRDSTKLGPRKGLLIAALETTIRIFKCSNQNQIVGGKVTADAVGPSGYCRQSSWDESGQHRACSGRKRHKAPFLR